MKFYGNASFQHNGQTVADTLAGDGSAQIQNAVLQTLSTFPVAPKVGQVAFVNSIVYICVTTGSLPIWVPLTREITAYTHSQNSASATWTIIHGMNSTSVNVQIFTEANVFIIPDTITVNSPDVVTVTFGSAQQGRAVVLTGHFDGNVKPTYAYTHYQSSAATSWVINHGLGYNPIVRVFIGNQEVQPSTVVHDTVNQTTITFSTAQVGYARLV